MAATVLFTAQDTLRCASIYSMVLWFVRGQPANAVAVAFYEGSMAVLGVMALLMCVVDTDVHGENIQLVSKAVSSIKKMYESLTEFDCDSIRMETHWTPVSLRSHAMGIDDVPRDELQKAVADAAHFLDLVKMFDPIPSEPLDWFLTAFEPLLAEIQRLQQQQQQQQNQRPRVRRIRPRERQQKP